MDGWTMTDERWMDDERSTKMGNFVITLYSSLLSSFVLLVALLGVGCWVCGRWVFVWSVFGVLTFAVRSATFFASTHGDTVVILVV